MKGQPHHRTGTALLCGNGVEVEQALASVVIELKDQLGPFGPISLIAGRASLGIGLRRLLLNSSSPLVGMGVSGLAGVEVSTPLRFATSLVASTDSIAKRTRLSRSGLFRAVSDALHELEPGLTPGVGLGHPASVDAVARHVLALDQASPMVQRGLLESGHPLSELVARCHLRVRESIGESFYLPSDLLDAAVDRLVYLADQGLSLPSYPVLYLSSMPTYRTQRLLAELVGNGARVIALSAGGDDPVRELLSSLGLTSESDPIEEIRAPITLLRAPDVTTEVDEVATEVIRAHEADGVAFGDMAVLFSTRAGYQSGFEDCFKNAGAPVEMASGRSLAQSVAGRCLLGFIEFACSERSLRDLYGLVQAAPVHLGVDHVQALSVLGWAGGAYGWRGPVDALASAVSSGGPDRRAGASSKELLVRILELTSHWLERFDSALRDDPLVLVEVCGDLLEAVVVETDSLVEMRARDQIAELLSVAVRTFEVGLRAKDPSGSEANLGSLLDVLDLELGAAMPRKVSSGVSVASIAAGFDLPRRYVFVVGAVEGQLPTRHRPDPLIPDWVRESLAKLDISSSASFPSSRALVDRQQREFELALRSATLGVWISLPKGDSRANRPHIPSRFINSFGQPGESSASRFELDSRFQAIAERDFFGWPQQAELALAMSEGCEPDLSGQYLLDRLTARALFGSKTFSPSRLEDLAECPHRFFATSGLGIDALEVAPDEVEASKALSGSIVHAVLCRLVGDALNRTELPERLGDGGLSDLIDEVIESGLMLSESRGQLGSGPLVRTLRADVASKVEAGVEWDESFRRSSGAVPIGVELGFGGDGGQVLEFDRGVVRLRGRIDRVDRLANGTTVVLDYKTGKVKNETDPRRMQLGLYSLVAEGLFGNPVEPYFVNLSGKVGQCQPKEPQAARQLVDRTRSQLSVIFELLYSGVMLTVPGSVSTRPGKSLYENCIYCPIERACSTQRAEIFRIATRNGASEATRGYLQLINNEEDWSGE